MKRQYNTRHIGEILQEKLDELEMTQKKLAELTNLPSPMISEYMTGKRKVSPKSCIAIGLVLDISPYELGRMQSDYLIAQAFKVVIEKTKESVNY